MLDEKKESYVELQTPFGLLSSHIDNTRPVTSHLLSRVEDIRTVVKLGDDELKMRPRARAALRKLIEAGGSATNSVDATDAEISDVRRGLVSAGVQYDPRAILKKSTGGGFYIVTKIEAPSQDERLQEGQKLEANTALGMLNLFCENGEDLVTLDNKNVRFTDPVLAHAFLQKLMTQKFVQSGDVKYGDGTTVSITDLNKLASSMNIQFQTAADNKGQTFRQKTMIEKVAGKGYRLTKSTSLDMPF